jgi:hypothetical protein
MQIMLESGYAEETARQQAPILAGIREEIAPIVAKLKAAREKVIERLACSSRS